MSAWEMSLIADYGVGIVFCVTFLSCLALPVPSSLLMLAAGGFAATGDLSLTAVLLAAFGGAVLGDNCGYWLARVAGAWLAPWLGATPARAALRDRAAALLARRGGMAVFLSRWLVSPLGPSINYLSGLTRFCWLRFALWGAAGEAVWVVIYVGLGHAFADNITTLADVLGNASGLVTAAAVAAGLGLWLWRASGAHGRAA